MSTDAIVVLKQDHARVKKLFREFEQAGPGAKETKNRVVRTILAELHGPHVPGERGVVPGGAAAGAGPGG